MKQNNLFFYYLIVKAVLTECKTEKRNSQYKHGQPMEQTRALFCMCYAGVAPS